MSGSWLETVRRVAVLRTAAAQAAVGAAGVRRQLAEQHHQARLSELAGATLTGGSAGDVQAGLDGLQRLAGSVGDAGREVLLRDGERKVALAGYLDASRRARLLDDVCARHRSERDAARELSTQHLLDDLSGRSDGAWS